jgi:hypothetical protein
MHLPRLLTGLAAGWVAVGASAAADPVRPATAYRPASTSAPSVLDAVDPAFRDAVGQVVRQPTISAKAADEPFTAHAKVYDWLLDHPDRACLTWRRMGVACVEITELGRGRFHWADGSGSELTWQAVSKTADSVVWYATGKVKPGALLPTAPVKAVAVLRAPRQPADAKLGTAEFAPTVSVYLQTDSKAAAAVMRMLGPAAPRMAEQGAEQLLLFFAGPARYVHKHPDEAATLLAPAKK